MDSHALDVLEFDRIRTQLAEACQSPMGRGLAFSLKPATDAPRVRQLQTQLREAAALHASSQPIPLPGLDDLSGLLERVRDENRGFDPVELYGVERSLALAPALRAFFEARRAQAPELAALADQFLDLESLREALAEAIESPGVVVDLASPKLWEIRKEIRRVEDEVRIELDRMTERESLRQALQHRNVTIRNGRFVLAVKKDMRGRIPGILHGHSQTGQTVFVEPAAVVARSSELKELRHRESTEVSRILTELSRLVFDRAEEVLATADLLAWFDLTAAKARHALQAGYQLARFAEDGALRLVTARHPLLVEAARERGEEVVPLDIRLREGFRLLVITGPNTGGKTVTLKTVGLLQVMFQSGLAIPAASESRLPVFASLFADIGDEQSIDQSLSTFSGHISNIAAILEKADRRTLVLLDELGAGTDPAEGAALGVAILEELKGRQATGVVTTHLGVLKEFAFANPEVENACVAFDPKTMRPTYELLIGQPGNSNALSVARRFGIPEGVLERARAILEAGPSAGRELMEALQKSRRALEEQRELAERRLRKTRNLQQAAEEKHRHLEKKGQRLDREAETTVDDAMKELRERVEPHLRALQNVPKSLLPHYRELAEILRGSVAGTSLASKRRDFIAGLKKGDEVFVTRFESRCRIRKFLREEEKIVVMVGSLPVEVDYDDVAIDTPSS
jgi:DNA mismatch repair protein MutS2